MSESTEAASSLSEGTGNSPGLHLLSPGWCTLSRESLCVSRLHGVNPPHIVTKNSPGDDFYEKYDINAMNRLNLIEITKKSEKSCAPIVLLY